MKKLILFILLFVTLKVSAQQTYWTISPPKSQSYNQSIRIDTTAGVPDSLRNHYFSNGNKWNLYYTAAQANARFTGGGGTSTGINGLNGTTNIGLGGTLTGNTTVHTGVYQLTFGEPSISNPFYVAVAPHEFSFTTLGIPGYGVQIDADTTHFNLLWTGHKVGGGSMSKSFNIDSVKMAISDGLGVGLENTSDLSASYATHPLALAQAGWVNSNFLPKTFPANQTITLSGDTLKFGTHGTFIADSTMAAVGNQGFASMLPASFRLGKNLTTWLSITGGAVSNTITGNPINITPKVSFAVNPALGATSTVGYVPTATNTSGDWNWAAPVATAWGTITGTLSAQTDLNTALSGKQATLVSGTNIKTINSTSLLGSGNITVAPSTGGTGYIQNGTSLQSSSNFNISGTGKFTSTNNATTIGGATSDFDMTNVSGDTFNIHLDNSTDILSLNSNTQLQFNAGTLIFNGGFSSNGDAQISDQNFLQVSNTITPTFNITTTGTTYLINAPTAGPGPQILIFTGSTSQSVQLPSPIAGGSCGSCSLIPNLGPSIGGQTYTINNNSSGTLTIVADDNSTVQVMAPNTSLQVLYNGTAGYTNASWNIIYYTGASGSGVTSVFGRSGSVVAATNDYTFSQIGSKPTTLGGYGITDAYPLSGNPSNFALQATTVSPGYGMLGGGSLAANRTLTADTTVLKSKVGAATDYTNLSARITGLSSTYQPLEDQRLSTTNSPSFVKQVITGTAGGGYEELPVQSSSPASATNKIRLYADSLNRLSWKNSTYRRTIRVPYPSDYTINMPYRATSTILEDSTFSAATYQPIGTYLTPTSANTLSNKSISGSSNTLTNIVNASLVNSSTTINGTSIALGASGTVPAAAGTLTGSTLSSGVTSSSLTSFANSPTLNTAVLTGLPTGTGVSNTSSASTLAARDANSNLYANAFHPNFTTSVSSATPIVLTVGSTQVQEITGSTAQTVTLPVASTLTTGWTVIITSASSATITVQSSGGNTVATLVNGNTATIWCVLASGTGLASWDRSLGSGSFTGTGGSMVLATGASLTSPTITTGTFSGNQAGSFNFSGSIGVIGRLTTVSGIVQKVVNTAINTSATVTAAQLAGGGLTSTSAALVTMTLPTATSIGSTISATQGTQFYFVVDNTAGANIVTVAVGSGMTAVSALTGGTLLTVTNGQSGTFLLVFSSATVCQISRVQ